MSQKTKSGTTFHNLQYTKNRKHFVKYIPASQLAAYKEATENYRRFMDLVDEYIDMMSERAAKEIEKEDASATDDAEQVARPQLPSTMRPMADQRRATPAAA